MLIIQTVREPNIQTIKSFIQRLAMIYKPGNEDWRSPSCTLG